MTPLRIFSLIFSLVAISLTAANTPIPWQFQARDPLKPGDVDYDPATGLVTALDGGIITYQNVVLTANKYTANEQTGEVVAEGAVSIQGEGGLWRGEHVVYNFKTKKMETDAFRTGRGLYFIAGEGLSGDATNKTYTATKGLVTTDDYAEPSYRIRARKLTLVPGEYLEAEQATLSLGSVPIFYWPKYKRSFHLPPNGFSFTPGYRSSHGAYLLSRYRWQANTNLSGVVHFDGRSRRGLAGGPDFNYDAGKFGAGTVEYYFADDQDAGEDYIGRTLSPHRQRLSFSHAATPDTNFTFKTAIRYQNDPLIVRDFFEGEYRKNVQPNSFVEANRLWDNWSLNVLAQPQINDFSETVERLPDVKLTGLRQQLGETPLYYDSESSAGYFRRRFSSTNLLAEDFSAFRGDTYHQITLPQNYFGWLNFTPRIGGRFTHYSETHGAGSAAQEEDRGVFNTGAEISTKLSRVWRGAESEFLEVKGLRHILEPSVNYVYVPTPTTRPAKLPPFDYELPSLRLRPIEYPDDNAIDAIDSQNVLRLTLRNKLQTKRGDGIENLVNWALYTDWRLDPRTNQNTLADVYSDLDLRPRSWLTLNSETRFDTESGSFREANHRLTLLPNATWSLTLGHRYLDEDPTLGLSPTGHNLIYDSFYYRLNENWGWRMSHYYETRDGVMEEQYYTLYRDLRSWTAALTLRMRERRSGQNDITVALTFSLKAFPRFKMGDDRDKPESLLGD